MSLLPTIGAVDQDTGFYNGVATQSLMFQPNNLLSETLGTSTNQQKQTISLWFKRTEIATEQGILASNQNTATYFRFESTGAIRFRSTSVIDLKTNRLFRDTSAWYHLQIIMDFTSAESQDDKVKIYINGVRETSFATNTLPSNDSTNSPFNVNGAVVYIGSSYSGGATGYFNGYISEVNVVDGLALGTDSFAETKNGVWIAKTPSVTYGDNGYRLQFKETGTGTGASDTIGADTSSGTAHHFDSSTIVASDCNMPDSPENNFCTWNPLSNTGVTLSEGNLQTSVGASHVCGGTMAVTSGKWYWECKLKSTVNGSNPVILGFVSANTIAHAANFEQGVYFYTDNESNKSIVHVENNSATQTITVPSAMLPIAVDEVMQYAYDGDTGKIWVGIENVWADNSGGTSGNPSTGANPTFTLADTSIFMTPLRDHGGVAWTGLANFGQLSNDYTAPTDFNSLSTANLPEPTIGPNSGTDEQADNYFGILTYTGNVSGQTIQSGGTGVGGKIDFTPDWVWTKARSSGIANLMYDSVRGATKYIQVDADNQEGTGADSLTAFALNGFTVGADSSTTGVNNNSTTYVAWNWKAGDAPTASNSAGAGAVPTAGSVKIDGVNKSDALSGSIPATKISANTTAGFSIVTYTGNGTGGATVGHGLDALNKVPDALFIYNRDDDTEHPMTFPNIIGADEYLYIHATNGDDSFTNFFNDTNPTSSVFSVGSDNRTNGNTKDFVAYLFTSIEGYSKFGSYTGNGDNNGTFVYLGFRPTFIMTKRTNSTSNWVIQDSVRQTFNPSDAWLRPNTADAEGTSSPDLDLDFVSNGFKIRNNGTDNNISGSTYIYMAFAEAPFKYANAR